MITIIEQRPPTVPGMFVRVRGEVMEGVESEQNGYGGCVLSMLADAYGRLTLAARFEREKAAAEAAGKEWAAEVAMWPHVWRVRTNLPERFGEKCRVIACGKLNSAMVEFVDGVRVVTCRYYVRRRKA